MEVGVELVSLILGSNLVTNVVSSFFTFKITKRKYNSEVDNNLIKNMQESLAFYKQLVDDNNKRLEDVLKRNEDLNAIVVSQQSEILEIYKFLGVQSKEELIKLKDQLIRNGHNKQELLLQGI